MTLDILLQIDCQPCDSKCFFKAWQICVSNHGKNILQIAMEKIEQKVAIMATYAFSCHANTYLK